MNKKIQASKRLQAPLHTTNNCKNWLINEHPIGIGQDKNQTMPKTKASEVWHTLQSSQLKPAIKHHSRVSPNQNNFTNKLNYKLGFRFCSYKTYSRANSLGPRDFHTNKRPGRGLMQKNKINTKWKYKTDDICNLKK